MRKMMSVVIGLALIALAGCSAMKQPTAQQSPNAPYVQKEIVEQATSGSIVYTGPCQRPLQQGCHELVLGNYLWDEKNPLMKGLDQRAKDGLDRQQRAQFLGPKLWQAQHEGKVQVAGKRSFIVQMWNVNPAVSDAQVTGYRMKNSRGEAVRIVPVNVTGQITPSKSSLGVPDRVYRIQTDGVAVSLQFPWELITDKTAFVVCAENGDVIYPNKATFKQGHLINSESFIWLRNKGSVKGLMPFLSTQ